MFRKILYAITRPLFKFLIYPGATKWIQQESEEERGLGGRLWELLGAERAPLAIDVRLIKANTYRERWSAVCHQFSDEMIRLGLSPSESTLSSSLGMPPPQKMAAREAVAIIFLGNAMFYEDAFAEAATYLDRGLSLLLFNYPGFGESPGTPNSKSTAAAAEEVYEWVRVKTSKKAPIILHGLSLGGGVAAYLMKKHSAQDKNLFFIGDRTFSSMVALAEDLFAIPLLNSALSKLVDVLYPYPVAESVQGLGQRVALFRAAHDTIMAPFHAEVIALSALKGTEGLQLRDIITDVPGGHNHGDGGEVSWLYDTESQQALSNKLDTFFRLPKY